MLFCCVNKQNFLITKHLTQPCTCNAPIVFHQMFLITPKPRTFHAFGTVKLLLLSSTYRFESLIQFCRTQLIEHGRRKNLETITLGFIIPKLPSSVQRCTYLINNNNYSGNNYIAKQIQLQLTFHQILINVN